MYPLADAGSPSAPADAGWPAKKPPPEVPGLPVPPHGGGPAALQWGGGGSSSDDEDGGGGPPVAIAYGTVAPGGAPRASPGPGPGGGGWGPEEVVVAMPVQRPPDSDGPAGR
jgi:hypothetical protein